MGRPRDSLNASPRRSRHHRVCLLRLRHGAYRPQRRSPRNERRHSFRCASIPLVREHRFHLKDHAALPVGRARRPLVPHLDASARGCPLTPARSASGQSLVRRPPFAQVASLLSATSPGHIKQRRTPLRILAPEFVGTQRRCAPARQSPSLSSLRLQDCWGLLLIGVVSYSADFELGFKVYVRNSCQLLRQLGPLLCL